MCGTRSDPETLQSKLRICGTAELCVCGAFIYLLSIPALCVPVLTPWCPDPKHGARMYLDLVLFYCRFCSECFLIYICFWPSCVIQLYLFMQIYLDGERKFNQIEKRSERAWYSRDGCSWQLCAWNMRGWWHATFNVRRKSVSSHVFPHD